MPLRGATIIYPPTVTETRRRIDIIQDPEFLESLAAVPLEELRGRRTMCSDLDVELSFYRRMIHGRLDLLAFELRRRAGEEHQSLLEALPRILSEGAYLSQPGLPARSLSLDVPDIPSPGRRLVDRALEGDFLARLPSLDDEELRQTQAFLDEVEADVSRQRRLVHDALDVLHRELTRRYREGLADSGGLLTSE